VVRDLALLHQRHLGHVLDLDGILEADDVSVLGAVDVVDERRQRRRLAR
jgi:hypothetical protein